MSRAFLWLFLLSGVIYVSLEASLTSTGEDKSKRCTCNDNNNNGQWINEATGHFEYECNGRDSITTIASKYDQPNRDRIWRMSCGYNKAVKNCVWTAYINGWDKTLTFECSHHGFIAGIESHYRKANYDRQFKFKCCHSNDYVTQGCITSAYVNAWKMPFEVVIPREKGYYLVGMNSIHENKFQDRRWKFKYCKLLYKGHKK